MSHYFGQFSALTLSIPDKEERRVYLIDPISHAQVVKGVKCIEGPFRHMYWVRSPADYFLFARDSTSVVEYVEI